MFIAHLRRLFVHCIIFPNRCSGQTSKPNPFMQDRYWSMVDWQSFAGSAALEKSMHSSRFDFSSLQTQHGYDNERVSTSGDDKRGTGIVRVAASGADGPWASTTHRNLRALVAARLPPRREWLGGRLSASAAQGWAHESAALTSRHLRSHRDLLRQGRS